MLRYFAYGCNMNLAHLRSYLESKGVDPADVSDAMRATLADFRLRANYFSQSHGGGVCTIEECPGNVVEGVLMQITTAVRDALRFKEGWPDAYMEADVSATLVSTGQPAKAITYYSKPEHRRAHDMAASAEYTRLVEDGAAEFGLSSAYRSMITQVLLGKAVG